MKTSESWRGDAGFTFAFSIPVRMRTGHKRSGKLTPTRGMMGGIPGKRYINRYATAKCPMNMTEYYTRIDINGSVYQQRCPLPSPPAGSVGFP
jgi:hypothetical protein